MNFKIWIGVDDHGRPLVGAAACNEARDRGALHDCDQIFPSQLRYRICAFYPESGSGSFGSLKRYGKRCQLPGKWRIVRRTDAQKDVDKMIAVYGLGDPDHEFPRADHARSTRRKVSP